MFPRTHLLRAHHALASSFPAVPPGTQGMLVYELMANGNLEDHLLGRVGRAVSSQAQQTPPLSWQHRVRIAAEVAAALLCLHSADPEPIVHMWVRVDVSCMGLMRAHVGAGG